MNHLLHSTRFRPLLALLLSLSCAGGLFAQPLRAPEPVVDPSRSPYRSPPDLEVLPDEKWDQINGSVARALAWLASQQDPDGSYPTHIGGRPGVTALATLAFLSAGRLPGEGPDGATINKGIDYVLASQRPDGMFLVDSTSMPATNFDRGAHTGLYNHAVSSLMLCEAYGLVDEKRQGKIKPAIERAITFARKMQLRTQRFPDDKGGFRYVKSMNLFAGKGDADLSVTGWFVMFYRAAKNAGFEVPKQYIDDAIAFVRRCYDPPSGAFYYGLHGHDRDSVGRAMTGAG
ncbi:MAG: terpene cyclase/mutase family protein, partial [Planctomycetales bacterium]|nr:terpene cyclase/mutase family protein [Planctomycetales bacterium]